MEEIKIKVWDTKKKKFLLDTDFLIGADESVYDFTIDSDLNYNKSDRAIVVKYTGKKDVKNKEIHNGDVVKFNYYKTDEDQLEGIESEEVGVIEYAPNICRFIIVYNKGESWISIGDYDTGYGEEMDIANNLEVIGNIYENPELLEG